MTSLERRSSYDSISELRRIKAEDGNPKAILESWSRDMLYRKAVELDIDGRSKMTKAQLIHALRNY